MTIYAHQKSKKRKAYSKERRSIDAMTRELRMKYNINVIKSVWHRLRKTKASHARRDPLERRNLHRSVLSNGGFRREAETPLQSKEFPRTTAIAAVRITPTNVLVRHGNGSPDKN